jgi:hypothetical protein
MPARIRQATAPKTAAACFIPVIGVDNFGRDTSSDVSAESARSLVISNLPLFQSASDAAQQSEKHRIKFAGDFKLFANRDVTIAT